MVNGSVIAYRFVPGVGLGAALLLLATACSSGSTTASGSPTPAASSMSATSASASATPTAGGTTAAQPCSSTRVPAVSGSGPADTVAAGNQVATDYRTFFDPAVPDTAKTGLLQNGSAFQPVLLGFANNALANKASVTVLTVDFTGASSADVTFNLCESGQVALPGSQGKSVLEGGTWKVADATLCSLVKLNSGGAPVPGCA